MTDMEQAHKAVLIKLCNRPKDFITGIHHKNSKRYFKYYYRMKKIHRKK